jgi:phage tail-like protein
MATTGSRDDPYAAFNFIIEIDGIPVAGFSECTGLSHETTVIEYRNGDELAHPRALPGLVKFMPIELKQGFTGEMALWEWSQSVVDGRTVRRTGSIKLLNEARQPALKWNFVEGWPSKWDGPALGAGKNEVAIQGLRINHEGITQEKA